MAQIKFNDRPIIPFKDVKDAGLVHVEIPSFYRKEVEKRKKKVQLGQMKKPLSK